MFKNGDYVTRQKYGDDILFKIVSIENEIAYLVGVDIRLCADSSVHDLNRAINIKKNSVRKESINLNRELFYIPGIILHLDSDKEYLDKCIKYYSDNKIKAYYELTDEKNYKNVIMSLVNKYKPSIVVITGHDAHYKSTKNGKSYKNSEYFIEAINIIKNMNLIIFAGACQSDYESLIKAGASFASSPKRINIHALDPAIVAVNIATTPINNIVDVKKVLELTEYKEDGIGGLYINGTMMSGYPRGKL